MAACTKPGPRLTSRVMKEPQFAARLDSRAVLAVSGDERTDFLQGLVTNDVTRLAPTCPVYAGLLTPQGKLLFDFLLWTRDDAILIDVARGHTDSLARRLTMYKLRANVTIAPRPELAIYAYWGGGALPGTADPRLGALGTRAIVQPGEPANAGEADYIAHRLALGVGEASEIGDEATYPLEANFELLHGVDFKKGCYVGQELTARMKHKSVLRKRVLPVALDGTAALGAAIMAGEREIGELRAVAGARGLALVRLDRLAESAGTPLRAGDATVTVQWPDWIPR